MAVKKSWKKIRVCSLWSVWLHLFYLQQKSRVREMQILSLHWIVSSSIPTVIRCSHSKFLIRKINQLKDQAILLGQDRYYTMGFVELGLFRTTLCSYYQDKQPYFSQFISKNNSLLLARKKGRSEREIEIEWILQ